MAEAPDFVAVVKALMEKTRAGKVEWAVPEGFNTAPSFLEGSYFAKLPNGLTFEVKRLSEGTIFSVAMQDASGAEISRLSGARPDPPDPFAVTTVAKIFSGTQRDSEHYPLLSELYEAARTQALNVPGKLGQAMSLLKGL